MTVKCQSSNEYGCFLLCLYSASALAWIQIHSVSNYSFDDDDELLQSCPLDQIHATVLTMHTCISDAKTWIIQNKLTQNDGKTEAVLIKSNRILFFSLFFSFSFSDALRTSLRVDIADIPIHSRHVHTA